MYKQYSADKLLSNCQKYWPDKNMDINFFAVYLHRLQQLSLKLAMQTVAHYQLSSSEFDVLAALRNSAPPYTLTPTELQRSMLITSGGLTKLLYQLEAQELISRSVQEQDKRSKMVHLTDKGKNLIEKSMTEAHDFDREIIQSALTDNELSQLNTLLGKLTRAYENKDGNFTTD